MAWRYTFNTLPAGNLPALDFDQMFNDAGALTVVQCTATGTNAIALTPVSNTPAQSMYSNLQRYSFLAANTATGSVTIAVSGLAALPLYAIDGVTQLGSGAIMSGKYYDIVYNSALNSSTGGFALVSEPSFTPFFSGALSGDIALANTSIYYDGPSIAQGVVGTWFVCGTVTVTSTTADGFEAKLWDGTNLINSCQFTNDIINGTQAVSLCGVSAAPAGNLKISVRDGSSTNGKIVFNGSGLSNDSNITAFRIA